MRQIMKITGPCRLSGTVRISGSKNASAAIIPATILAKGECILENLPDNNDTEAMLDTLRYLGASVTKLESSRVSIDTSTIDRCDPPDRLMSIMRASYYFVPVLLGTKGKAEVAMPGGCNIGPRPIDQTLKGLRLLGANVYVDDVTGKIMGSCDHLTGADVYFDIPSVGATANTMMAAVMASGRTTLHNAAKEPHIVDLANFLCAMGARVLGAGTDIIRITGGRPMHGTSYAIIPDQIETGTYMIAAAATQGDVTIEGVIPLHMEALTAKLLEMGVSVTTKDDTIHISSGRSLRPVEVKTQVYPGFPTDLQQPLTALLTMANGTSSVYEQIFENRFRFTAELNKMGADITVSENNRIAKVNGVEALHAADIMATDLRAGAAMVIAGLMAQGTTRIDGCHYILRGYERMDEKLRALNADIECITTED